MDWARYKELEREEWEAMKATPITLEVTAEEFRDWKFGMMLLRRVQNNTKDGDLLRVDEALVPLLGRIREAFDELPEVQKRRFERNKMLNAELVARGQEATLREE
jgi:hypothetical protein